jgi:hypothetical protein
MDLVVESIWSKRNFSFIENHPRKESSDHFVEKHI